MVPVKYPLRRRLKIDLGDADPRVPFFRSMVFASHTVHVTSEAKASPRMTACTSMSALTNIDQGDKSRGR